MKGRPRHWDALRRFHNSQLVIWQWSLQLNRFFDRLVQPRLALIPIRQHDRHGFAVHGLHQRVGRRGQECIKLVLAFLS
jgi:hypothetical protein